jgi:hypothetical protein
VIQGTSTIDNAVRVAAPATEPLELPDVELLQVIYEIAYDQRESLLPPALHPVSPPCIALSFIQAPGFTLGEVRVLCRSGMRTRGYHLGGWIDDAAMAEVLTAGWGYSLTVADVRLDRRYHGTRALVVVDGRIVVETGHHRPTPIAPSDLQYTSSMHPVELDRGVRLLQVERAYDFKQAERGTPFLTVLEGPVTATSPVSASSASADVVLKPPRFACRPDVWAFEGTEPL